MGGEGRSLIARGGAGGWGGGDLGELHPCTVTAPSPPPTAATDPGCRHSPLRESSAWGCPLPCAMFREEATATLATTFDWKDTQQRSGLRQTSGYAATNRQGRQECRMVRRQCLSSRNFELSGRGLRRLTHDRDGSTASASTLASKVRKQTFRAGVFKHSHLSKYWR